MAPQYVKASNEMTCKAGLESGYSMEYRFVEHIHFKSPFFSEADVNFELKNNFRGSIMQHNTLIFLL